MRRQERRRRTFTPPAVPFLFVVCLLSSSLRGAHGAGIQSAAVEGGVFSPPYQKVWVLRGLQRSGTNLVQQSLDCVLGRHGVQAFQPLMEAIWRPRMRTSAPGSYLDWHGKGAPLPFFLTEDKHAGTSFDISVPSVRHQPLWKHHLPHTEHYCPIKDRRLPVWRQKCYANNMTSLQALDDALKRVSGYPWGFLFPEELVHVVVVKNPFHWLVSISKNKAILNSEFEPSQRDADSLLSTWTQCYRWWLDEEVANVEKLLMVRYEDVLFDREAVLKRVGQWFGCSLLGVPEECVTPHNVRMSKHADFRDYQKKLGATSCWEGVLVPSALLTKLRELRFDTSGLGSAFRDVVDRLGYSCREDALQHRPVRPRPEPLDAAGRLTGVTIRKRKGPAVAPFWPEVLNLHRAGPALDCGDQQLAALSDAFVLGFFSTCRFANVRHFYWDDTALGKLVREEFPEHAPVLLLEPKVRMWDFTRLLVVYAHGGVHLDLDFTVHKPLQEHVHGKSPNAMNLVVEDRHGRLQNSFFMFQKGDPVLKVLIEESWQRIQRHGEEKGTAATVKLAMGAFQTLLSSKEFSSQILVLPNARFNPPRKTENHGLWCFQDVCSQQLSTWSWAGPPGGVENRNKIVVDMVKGCAARMNTSLAEMRRVVWREACAFKG